MWNFWCEYCGIMSYDKNERRKHIRMKQGGREVGDMARCGDMGASGDGKEIKKHSRRRRGYLSAPD